MIQKLKILLLASMSFLTFTTATVTPAVMAITDEAKNAACTGANQVEGGGTTCAADNSALNRAIEFAIRIFQVIAGVITLFVIILAGLGYVTSGGDSSKTKAAKDRLLYAAIGILIIALSEAIIQFVLNRANEAATVTTP